MKKHMATRWILLAGMAVLCSAVPALAEQGFGESADFVVNTVPEPAAIIAVLGALLAWRHKR